MRLVTEDDLASIDAPDPEGDGIDACLLADPELGPVLRVYLVLTRRPSLFIRSGWSPESIVWSLYYWFRRLVALRAASSGFDAGLEQQAFQILEAPHPACELDWSELESIEALAVEHAMTQRRRRPGADDDPFAGK